MLEALLKVQLPENSKFVSITRNSGFRPAASFGYSTEEESEYFDALVLLYDVPRLETDEEFLKRMKDEERQKKEVEEREKILYLKLKAKFEK